MTTKIVRANGAILTGSVIKSCTYTETVNAGTDLRPGCVASAYIDVEVFGSQANAPSVGEELTYYQVNGNTETLIGKFYAEPSIPSKNTYKFLAYDAVAKLDVDYSERLNAIQNSFPMTLSALVSDVCTVAGVTLTGTVPMGTTSINAFYAEGITCRQILQYAAEIACRFVRCNTSGQILFDWYTNDTTHRVYPQSGTGNGETYVAYKQGGLSYENYTVQALGAVAIRPTGTEGAAYIYPTNLAQVYATDANSDGNVTLYNLVATDDGNGNITLSGAISAEDDGSSNVTVEATASNTNSLIISNNLLLTDATQATYLAVAQQIYDTISAMWRYRPAQIELFTGENPFRAGQAIQVTDIQGVSFTTLVMTMSVLASSASLRSTGNESYSSDTGTDTRKTLTDLAASIVQINKLKVGWADIQEAIVQYLKLYGTMTVYTDSSLTTKGGDLGYVTGSNSFGNGIVIQRLDEYSDALDLYTYVKGGTVVAGENAVFIGYTPGSLKVDGAGVDVPEAQFPAYIRLDDDGFWMNPGVIAGAAEHGINIYDSFGNGTYSTLSKTKIDKWDTKSDELGDLANLDTTDKGSAVDAINEVFGKFPVSVADGGTGATTAAGARTNLGIVAGESASASGTITLANRTVSNVCSITLPSAGTYILIGFAEFASDANGVRTLSVNSTTSLSGVVGRTVNGNAVDGYPTRLNISTPPITISASQTWYLNVWQNSGSSFDVSGNIAYVRLA